MIDRSFLISGPAKITVGGTVLYTQGDIEVAPAKNLRDINSSLHGPLDKSVLGASVAINFTPMSVWAAAWRTVLFPAAFLAPAFMGARLFGNADQAVVIDSVDGQSYTFHNARLTQMPEIFCGISEELFGGATITALRKNNSVMGDADSLMTIGASAWDGTDFPTPFDQSKTTAAFGAVSGMTAMNALNGWRVQHEIDLGPVEWDGETIDFKVRNYRAIARGIAVQPTAAQILSALAVQGVAAGSRLSATANDLAITGTNFAVTLKKANVTDAGFVFGVDPLRNGEIAFATTLGFTAGAADPRLVLA